MRVGTQGVSSFRCTVVALFQSVRTCLANWAKQNVVLIIASFVNAMAMVLKPDNGSLTR